MAEKLGFNATWSMAVGGMVGGGIFSTLGVVIGISGPWAWLAFLIAGVIALLAGYSFIALTRAHGEAGGAFTFLREMHDDRAAGTIAWVLIIGYVLTNAVYAFTFGQYLAHVFGLGAWFPRLAAVAIVSLFVAVNVRGVGEASLVEILLVWFKLVVLVGLAVWGLGKWDTSLLSRGVGTPSPWAGLLGAASVFMAYEGFELLSYDYDDIEQPKVVLPHAMLSAIVVVTAVYVVVALGTPMLVGADVVVAQQEVALAVAGEAAAGIFGLVLVTIAAAFSTGSAINSTLFATARLSHTVARAGELPAWIDHLDDRGIPNRAVVLLGVSSATLAAIGSLDTLVEAASLAFLGTFAVVGGLAFRQRIGHRGLTALGTLGAVAAASGLAWRLAVDQPITLAVLGVLVLVATVVRPLLLARVTTE